MKRFTESALHTIANLMAEPEIKKDDIRKLMNIHAKKTVRYRNYQDPILDFVSKDFVEWLKKNSYDSKIVGAHLIKGNTRIHKIIIHKIADLLERGVSIEEISNQTDVSIDNVKLIYKRKTSNNILDQYKGFKWSDFIASKNENIYAVCALLESGYLTLAEIAKTVGVSTRVVKDIVSAKTHTSISKLYNFRYNIDIDYANDCMTAISRLNNVL